MRNYMQFDFVMSGYDENGDAVNNISHSFVVPDGATHMEVTERYFAFLKAVGYCFKEDENFELVDSRGNIRQFLF